MKASEGGIGEQIDESKAEPQTSSYTTNKPADHDDTNPQPPKDYIHVRARRGQATDSHSLAERVILALLTFVLLAIHFEY